MRSSLSVSCAASTSSLRNPCTPNDSASSKSTGSSPRPVADSLRVMKPGDPVSQGAPLARIVDVYGDEVEVLRSPVSGAIVLGIQEFPVVATRLLGGRARILYPSSVQFSFILASSAGSPFPPQMTITTVLPT